MIANTKYTIGDETGCVKTWARRWDCSPYAAYQRLQTMGGKGTAVRERVECVQSQMLEDKRRRNDGPAAEKMAAALKQMIAVGMYISGR